jgi:hypothetical protein
MRLAFLRLLSEPVTGRPATFFIYTAVILGEKYFILHVDQHFVFLKNY